MSHTQYTRCIISTIRDTKFTRLWKKKEYFFVRRVSGTETRLSQNGRCRRTENAKRRDISASEQAGEGADDRVIGPGCCCQGAIHPVIYFIPRLGWLILKRRVLPSFHPSMHVRTIDFNNRTDIFIGGMNVKGWSKKCWRFLRIFFRRGGKWDEK